MIQAGEVGVIFDGKNETSATLQRIADEFNKMELPRFDGRVGA
jgi:hypothetical protein